ncbi:MAG: ABC transporter ATP-binding protein [Candidatus Aureabacteria bacterium]|nr:ABC transporter ATP-binding protein [Candidatus Auribacterota bacterium]
MAESEDIILQVRGLRKSFPIHRGLFQREAGIVRAVDGVSFEIARGATLGLVGETGCGKTTLGRLILRLLPADGGEVWFKGENVLALPARRMRELRREMQIIFQDPFGSLNPRMKVGAIVGEGLQIFRRGTRREIESAVARLLERVGLPPGSKNLYPHEFSGGQRQRIGIARAIALNPAFIVCDEPVSSLDVSIQAQILNLLADLQEELGLAYLFIAHDLKVVEHISNRVAVMYRGRLVETADRESLYADPRHPYTRLLLESIPIPDPAAPRRDPPAVPAEAPDGDGCLFFPRCVERTDECRTTIPELKEVSPEHQVACIRQKSEGRRQK